jgi:outer membrane protein W
MRKSSFIVSVVLGAITLAASPALAEGEGGAVSLGARVGYGIPLGKGTDDPNADLNKSIAGMVPLWLDAGYKFTPNIYVGAFFMYGLGFIPSDATGCGQNGVSCSVHDIQFGVNAHYHFMPDQTIDPWVGVGLGYEILGVSVSNGSNSASASAKGFQFFNVQAGADYKVLPALGVGPFVSLSLGKYTSTSSDNTTPGSPGSASGDIQNTAFHEWLILGIRGTYDISL